MLTDLFSDSVMAAILAVGLVVLGQAARVRHDWALVSWSIPMFFMLLFYTILALDLSTTVACCIGYNVNGTESEIVLRQILFRPSLFLLFVFQILWFLNGTLNQTIHRFAQWQGRILARIKSWYGPHSRT